MNRENQRKITKNLIALRKTMQKDVDVIADKLCDVGVFTKEARNEIANIRPNIAQLKCGVLINKVLRSGSGTYEKFRDILEDMGYFNLVDAMEKSVSPDVERDGEFIDTIKTLREKKIVPQVNDECWQEEREKTFVIKDHTVSNRLKVPTTIQQMKPTKGQGRDQSDNQIEEVHQLERMMTFVLSNIDQRDSNKNKVEFKRDFKHRLMEESKGNEQLMGFFKTLRYNSFSLTSQSLRH